MPTFLAPWWALLGLLAIPIVLLYILRQRRPDTPISSTLLWTKALADMRASSPWQKLRRNLLLLLQLLILAALTLTLMRPVIHAQAAQTSAGVIVIDATASMLATDSGGGGGASRLDRAKTEARKLINAMRPGDRFNIIADGGGMAQNSTGFVSSKSELSAFLDNLKPSHGSSDLSESLLVAAMSLRAFGANAPRTESVKAGGVYLFSDGAGVSLPPVYKDLRLQYVQIGDSRNNAGITRLAVSPVPKQPRTYDIFVGLFNSSDQPREVTAGLSLGTLANLQDARKTTLAPGSQGGVTFEKVVADPGPIFVQLDGKNDDLAIDNLAYGVIAPPAKVNVLFVTAGNQLIDDFLQTAARLGEIEGRTISPQAFRPDMKADLVIFDGVTPKDLPRGDLFFLRPAESVAGFKIVGSLNQPAILRTKTDPLLDSVELSGVRILRAGQLERSGDLVELISATTGPLMAYRDAGNSRRYILTFSPLTESNWWRYGPSLVILLENMIQQTRARHFIGAPQVIPAGTPARLFDLAPGSTVTAPDGSTHPLDNLIKEGTADFSQTDQAGLYTVHSGGNTALFAANILSLRESDITPRALHSSADGNVDEARSVAAVNREIWQWLAVAGLLILLIEWIIYHRRIA